MIANHLYNPRKLSLMTKHKSSAPAPKVYYEKRIINALRLLTRYLDTHSRQLLKNQQITVPQVMCLDALRDNGAMTVAVLASAIHLSPSTMVGILDRLEKKHFITRTRDNVDRRSVFINITDEGRDFIQSSPHLLHNRLHDHLQSLTEDEQIIIANSLDRLLPLMSGKD